jgi:hypothetical protein
MDERIKFIVENHRTKIKIRDFFTVVLFTGVALIVGVIMLISAYLSDHPGWVIPAWIITGVSILVLIFSLVKLKIENSYDCINTGLTKKENIKLSKEIIIELFGQVKIFGSLEDGLLSFNIRSFLSKGKQITMISTDNKILLNCRDIKAMYTLFSRGSYMSRIKKRIAAKGKKQKR